MAFIDMTIVPRNYSEVVRTRRLARGLTQAELAERLGMTNVTVSRWEKGRVEPSIPLWEKFLQEVGDRPNGGHHASPLHVQSISWETD